MVNAIVKAMYATESAYCMVVGTAMTWAETAVEKAPLTSGAVAGAIIYSIFF